MGLVGLARVLAVEGAKNNIKANAIAPVARTRMTEELLGPIAEKLDPEKVSPLVAWLCHEDCPVTGQVFTVGGGRVARVFIGTTVGYFDAEITVESIRDHWDEIQATDGMEFPEDSGAEMMLGYKNLA
jgi:hypothetical protein